MTIGISRSVRSSCARLAVAEGLQRDAERSSNHAQRLEDADDAGGGDGAHGDEAHVIAIDVRTPSCAKWGWWRDRPGVAHVAADEPDQRDEHEVRRACRRRKRSWRLRRPIT